MGDPAPRRKIAILGGGVGAMTAAFELTSVPDWQSKYEITVYQLGWRLGGKGASGRNRARHDRIEEHGLHLWFGYYENAFNIIQRCYAELGRLPGEPLATWRDAFKPHSLFILMQFHDAKWTEWRLSPPTNTQTPGDGVVPPFWEIIDKLLSLLHVHYENDAPAAVRAVVNTPDHHDHPGFLAGLVAHVRDWLSDQAVEAAGLLMARKLVQDVAAAPNNPAAHAALADAVKGLEHFAGAVRKAVEASIGGVIDDLAGDFPVLARLVSLIELGLAMLRGIIADDVARKGFDQLDHLDLREWLASHGAGQLALDSDTLRAAYESIFAYSQGSYELPNLAAGTGLRGLLRLSLTYKGAFAWKMQAGMGDTIFAPFYQVLKQRGVKFEFFKAVRDIVPSSDGSRIEKVVIGHQATVINGAYNPLYNVNGLPCWPSTPDFSQLKEKDALEAGKINLESHWTPWADVGQTTLVADVDFHEIVLGISLGGLPHVAPRLIDQKPQWKAMVSNVEAIQTQAFQMWTKPDAAHMRTPRHGAHDNPDAEPPVFGGFAQPHNTIADMSHLLPRESWPPSTGPRAVYYFCGPLSQPAVMPPRSESEFPRIQSIKANARASEWLRSNAQFVLPGSMFAGYPESFPDTFNFSLLYDSQGPQVPAVDQFDRQFWRANSDPTELYVLSTKGSTKFRLRAAASGYSNLKLAGDWTFTGLNYGCVEAATMSGMEAARAICGSPTIIFGENFPLP